jgi:hypothetical protein
MSMITITKSNDFNHSEWRYLFFHCKFIIFYRLKNEFIPTIEFRIFTGDFLVIPLPPPALDSMVVLCFHSKRL